MTELKKTIFCEICGIEIKRITRTHLVKHNITTDDYKKQFPNSPIVSDNLAHALGKASRNMPPERRKQVSEWAKEFNTGKPKTKEHRENLSKAKIGVKTGKQSPELIARRAKAVSISMKLKFQNGYVRPPTSQETKNKLSEIVKNAYASGTRKKPRVVHNNKGKKLNLSPEQRANRSRKRSEYIKNNPSKFSNTKLEIKMKEYLETIGLQFTQQLLIEDNGSWLDDFHIPELNTLVETDGEYHHNSMFQINRDRIKEKVARRLGYKFIRISDKNWKPEAVNWSDEDQKEHCQEIIKKRLLKHFPEGDS